MARRACLRYSTLMIALALLLACHVTDGDTLRCGDERVRLLGIDAPELAGHCRQGRQCAPGDGEASKRSLEQLVGTREIRVRRFGTDRYGRTLAIAWAGDVNLGCAQLRRSQAIYIERWDTGGAMRAACGTSVANAIAR